MCVEEADKCNGQIKHTAFKIIQSKKEVCLDITEEMKMQRDINFHHYLR